MPTQAHGQPPAQAEPTCALCSLENRCHLVSILERVDQILTAFPPLEPATGFRCEVLDSAGLISVLECVYQIFAAVAASA